MKSTFPTTLYKKKSSISHRKPRTLFSQKHGIGHIGRKRAAILGYIDPFNGLRINVLTVIVFGLMLVDRVLIYAVTGN